MHAGNAPPVAAHQSCSNPFFFVPAYLTSLLSTQRSTKLCLVRRSETICFGLCFVHSSGETNRLRPIVEGNQTSPEHRQAPPRACPPRVRRRLSHAKSFDARQVVFARPAETKDLAFDHECSGPQRDDLPAESGPEPAVDGQRASCRPANEPNNQERHRGPIRARENRARGKDFAETPAHEPNSEKDEDEGAAPRQERRWPTLRACF